MALQIQRGKSEYTYRINPANGRILDRRLNVHRGRWEPFCCV